MDFQTFNQVHDSNSRRVIGLRIPKEFDLNLVPETTESDDEFRVSQVPSQASQNPTEEVNTVSNGLGAGDPALPSNAPNNTTSMQPLYSSHDNRRRVDPAGNGNSLDCDTGRTLCPRRLEVNDSDRRRVCTNYHCRTRNTPMWRKGPLGPKTLCNACGIQYKKQVASRGSNR